jgi:chloride channel 3/4/5
LYWCANHHVRCNHVSGDAVKSAQVTLLTTAFCFLNPYTRMGGTELVYNLLAECRTGSGNTHSGLCIVDPGSLAHVWPVARAILVAMCVKGALTVITFGIKVPAGIFIPTLGVGACAGRLLGIAVQWAQWRYPTSPVFGACKGDLDCVIPGLYAMVGAAAALSGVTVSFSCIFCLDGELTRCCLFFEAHDGVFGCDHVRAHRHLDVRRSRYAGGAGCQDRR